MELVAFPEEQIVEFLVNKLDMNQVTIQHLKNPTAVLVQDVYVRMLTELGFHTDSMLQPSLELMNTMDHPEVLKDMIPTLSLQAGLVDLIGSLAGKDSFVDFGIMDLLKPTTKRTARFISVMQNFWLFCNQRHEEADGALKGVEGLVEKRVKLENLIEDYKNNINRRRRKAVEDKATEDALCEEIEGLRADLESWGPRREELDREKAQLDGELGRLHAETEEAEARKRKLQAEIAALQGVFEGAATMEKLDQEIGQLVEDLQYIERNKLKLRNNLEALERTRVEYMAVLELVRQIAREEQKTREIMGKIREQHGKLDSIKMEVDELENDLREERQQAGSRRAEMEKVRLQAERRRRGKEEEVTEGRGAVEAARRQLGEAELASVELAGQTKAATDQVEEERVMMGQEAANIRATYSTLLEAIQKFNDKMNRDFDKIEEAKEAMNTPSAL